MTDIAEIHRLLAMLSDERPALARALGDEIERLREEAKDRSDLADEAMELVHEQEAEIERLRGLLREAVDSEISVYWYIRVREALGE